MTMTEVSPTTTFGLSLHEPIAGPSSPRSTPPRSLDLPSLQPLSHSHPLLTGQTFSADTFLLSRVHIPLDELRGELREYLGTLREELVQLVNDDYEEFISLGTGFARGRRAFEGAGRTIEADTAAGGGREGRARGMQRGGRGQAI